jgi:hypothetical protein
MLTTVSRARLNQRRWLNPLHGNGGVVVTSQTATAGRCILMQFEVTDPTYVDGISYPVGSVSNGNVRVAIYRPTTEDTSAGGALVVESADTAQAAANGNQLITFTAVYLTPGRYYAAAQYSSATGTYYRHGNQTQIVGVLEYFDQAYGAFPATVPAITATGSAAPGLRVRVRQG